MDWRSSWDWLSSLVCRLVWDLGWGIFSVPPIIPPLLFTPPPRLLLLRKRLNLPPHQMFRPRLLGMTPMARRKFLPWRLDRPLQKRSPRRHLD